MPITHTTILVLGDESALLRKTLADLGRVAPELALLPCSSTARAIELAQLCNPALVLLVDHGCEGKIPLALRHLHRQRPLLPAVVLDATPTVARAVDAMTTARDYVEASGVSPMQLADTVRRHMRRFVTSDGSVPAGTGRHGMVGVSSPMLCLFREIDDIGPTGEDVLVLGETGTGKELVARALHATSRRADSTFLAVNCAELADELFESELFGHRRGAFTGAVRDNPGLVRAAAGGTIFLDEIGELSVKHQAKLLRFIENKDVRALGSQSSVTVDVRIIAATNVDLRAAVARGAFRADLFHRLSAFEVEAPPLRTRENDIRLIVPFLLGRYASDGRIPEVSEPAMQQLLRATWHGNVRELINVVRRALVYSVSIIEHFRIDRRLDVSPAAVLDDATELQAQLRRHNGSLRELSREIGVSTRTLQRRARKFGLDPKRFKHSKRTA